MMTFNKIFHAIALVQKVFEVFGRDENKETGHSLLNASRLHITNCTTVKLAHQFVNRFGQVVFGR